MSYNAGENEGLGGLITVVQADVRNIKAEEGEESQEHENRRHALLHRDDPRVAEIDVIVAELNEEHAKGGTHAYPTWREDAKKAEHIFLETPDELPAWLERMRIKRLSKQEKRERVIKLAEKLVKNAIIAIPPEQWRIHANPASSNVHETRTLEEGGGAVSPPAPTQELTAEEVEALKEAHDENAILQRLGFIFIAYRVDYWWWEGVEMLRKFLMTWLSLPTPLHVLPSRHSPPARLVRLTPLFGLLAAASCALFHIPIHARLVSRQVVGQLAATI